MTSFPEPRAGDVCDHCNEGNLEISNTGAYGTHDPHLICTLCQSTYPYSVRQEAAPTSQVWVYVLAAFIFIPVFIAILKVVVFIVTYD